MDFQEYTEAAEKTLQYWIDIHTNAEKWAEMYNIGDDWQYLYKQLPVIHNNYFTFDLRKTVLTHTARRLKDSFGKCKCGLIWERGYENCDECNSTLKNVTIAELADWLQDMEFTPDENDIENCMIKDGFKVYRAALKSVTRDVETEAKDVLKQIHRAKDDTELIAAVTWANHVMHVNGNILADYGDRFELDYRLVERVSQEGIENVFEELKEET